MWRHHERSHRSLLRSEKKPTNEVGLDRLASKVFLRKGTTNTTHLSNKILTRPVLSFADAMKRIRIITTSRKEKLEQRMFALRWHVWIYTAEALHSDAHHEDACGLEDPALKKKQHITALDQEYFYRQWERSFQMTRRNSLAHPRFAQQSNK